MLDSDEWDETLIPLALELMTVAVGDDAVDFLEHCGKRFEEEQLPSGQLHRLTALLATFAGNAVAEWAKDIGVTHTELMGALALDIMDPDS